jgi:hypothetical protein
MSGQAWRDRWVLASRTSPPAHTEPSSLVLPATRPTSTCVRRAEFAPGRGPLGVKVALQVKTEDLEGSMNSRRILGTVGLGLVFGLGAIMASAYTDPVPIDKTKPMVNDAWYCIWLGIGCPSIGGVTSECQACRDLCNPNDEVCLAACPCSDNGGQTACDACKARCEPDDQVCLAACPCAGASGASGCKDCMKRADDRYALCVTNNPSVMGREGCLIAHDVDVDNCIESYMDC